jgi:spermidine synthase
MTKAYTRVLWIAFLASGVLPAVTVVSARLTSNQPDWFAKQAALAVAVVALASIYARRGLRRIEASIDADAAAQVSFADSTPPRYADLAIAGVAGLSLFLELAVIRWQSSVFPFFAFYTNFGLLACFAGLGLGYALASRDRIPLGLVMPLLAWQMALLIGLRAALGTWHLEFLGALPVVEQFGMGLRNVRTLSQGFAIYFFLSVVFLLTALAFVPIGQLCGRLMGLRAPLRAYGLNLLGSLGGVVAMFLASAFWTPPAVWYALAFGVILLFSVRRPATLMFGVATALVAITVLSWPVSRFTTRVFSPYQMLELEYSNRGYMQLRAAGHYYQRVHNLAPPTQRESSWLQGIRAYYDLPYRIRRTPQDVAIIGAGTGNDVAAALRGGAQRIDAIEIDPAILEAGRANHPENPYGSEKVHAIVNDARSFLRTTDRTYDLIVYGLLDSHTLLTSASSLRLDSYVYTVEGFREARARLKPGGQLFFSFSVLNVGLGMKMKEMLRQAFDGADPVVVSAGYDAAIVFLQSKEGDFVLPKAVLDGTSLRLTSKYDSPANAIDPSTDDWPFFYMPKRVYPVSYLVMLGMVLLGALVLTANFITERPGTSELSFFLLGAGFMLVETKAITELGLTFGSTWQVLAIVIAGILCMAFLANVAVQMLGIRRPHLAFVMLFVTLGAGWLIVGSGGLPPTVWGRTATVALLTSPMFFSGIVFSTLLGARRTVAAVMSANLLGAMCGGLLEYNSMYFGFRFLYLLAMGFYGLAFLHWVVSRHRAAVAVPLESARLVST